MLQTIPTYIIDGMLESGKTTFIKDTISSDDFFKQGTTLVIACEEGIVEYEDDFLEQYHCVVKYFDNQNDFTALNLQKIVNETRPKRIVLELNGMWDLNLIEFPTSFKIYQFIDFIDFQTFPIYFLNMRQKYLDIVKQSDVVVFINVLNDDEKAKLETYSSSFKLTNSKAQYMIMNKQMQLFNAFKNELPYDIKSDVIKLKDEEFGIWYIDTFENRNDYYNKIIDLNVMAFISSELPKPYFVAGRLVMTCCSNDVQLYGYICSNTLNMKIKDRSWWHIKAKMIFDKDNPNNEIVLEPILMEKTNPAKEEILDLTK